jgi:hypothetical protein
VKPSSLPSSRDVVQLRAGAGEQDLEITPDCEEPETVARPEPGLIWHVGREPRDLARAPAGLQNLSDRLLLALVPLAIARAQDQRQPQIARADPAAGDLMRRQDRFRVRDGIGTLDLDRLDREEYLLVGSIGVAITKAAGPSSAPRPCAKRREAAGVRRDLCLLRDVQHRDEDAERCVR